jgi:hypothetical protein
MKKSIWGGIFLLLGAPSFRPTASAAAPGELSPVIGHVLSEGKSNNIPPAFSYALGLSTNKPAAGKVIISRGDTETNSFWASLQDSNSAVMITRKANLSWYYLTDSSGQLRRAIVNDANIYHGGGTNLSLGKERERFEAHKRRWLRLYGH